MIDKQLFSNSYKGIQGITYIDHALPGPSVAVFAVTHGNEISGAQAISDLYEEIQAGLVVKGKLFLILHNVNAYRAFVEESKRRKLTVDEYRFIDQDLNRVYSTTEIQSDTSNHELERARQIATIIPEFDAVYDIHSTSTPSQSMLIYSDYERDSKFCNDLPVKTHLVNISKMLNGRPLNEYARDHGRKEAETISLAHESGYHFDTASIEEVKTVLRSFLIKIGCIDGKIAPPKEQADKYEIIRTIMAKSDRFYWAQSWKAFQEVEEGTLLATDNGKEITTDDNYILIMPSAIPRKDTEAVFLAKKL